jgi:hypothetical protein
MAASRRWCFTIFPFENFEQYPWAEDIETLPKHPKERYCVWQLEVCPTSGNYHVQGYVELSATVRLSSMVSWIPGGHYEVAQGPREACKQYCMKQETRLDGPKEIAGPFERGQWIVGQGARTDLNDAIAVLKERGLRAVAQDHPATFVRNCKGLEALAAILDKPPSDDGFAPRPWQVRVLARIKHHQEAGNDRNIIWVTDTVGGQGKSRLAKHLVCNYNGIQLEGRVQDMAHAFEDHSVAIFDISRAAADCTKHLYTFAEKLKNGMCFTSKYQSRQKFFKPPVVIFFSNASWDRSLFSADRVQEYDLANPLLHVNLALPDDPFQQGFA